MPGLLDNHVDKLPPASRERLVKAGIDLTNYPEWPPKPKSLTLATQVRGDERVHIERGKNANPEKKVRRHLVLN
jgi:hypothetical protein